MKKNFILIISVLIIISVTIGGYLLLDNKSSNNSETPSNIKFKDEYEDLNNQKDFHNNDARNVSISKDNPVIYATFKDIVTMIEQKESFIVYFGFTNCPWCRSMVTTFIDTAIEQDVDKIYYVDVYTTRDVYQINDENKLVRTTDASVYYYELLGLLSRVLEDYKVTDNNDNKVDVGEKRIYAPNVISIKDGQPIMNVGTSELQKDAYEKLSDDMIEDMKNIYIELFDSIK